MFDRRSCRYDEMSELLTILESACACDMEECRYSKALCRRWT
jgi:hypothetical protein